MSTEQHSEQNSRPEYIRKFNNVITDTNIPAATVRASITNAVAQRHTFTVACDHAPADIRQAFERIENSDALSGSTPASKYGISCCNCGGTSETLHTAELIIAPITESATHTSWNVVLIYQGSIAFSAKTITSPWRWVNAVNEILKKISAAAADLHPAGQISPFERVFNSFHIVNDAAHVSFCNNRKLLDSLG